MVVKNRCPNNPPLDSQLLQPPAKFNDNMRNRTSLCWSLSCILYGEKIEILWILVTFVCTTIKVMHTILNCITLCITAKNVKIDPTMHYIIIIVIIGGEIVQKGHMTRLHVKHQLTFTSKIFDFLTSVSILALACAGDAGDICRRCAHHN